MSYRGDRARCGPGQGQKFVGNARDLISVTHPDVELVGQTVEEIGPFQNLAMRRTVLAGRGTFDASAQRLASQLHPVTDPQHGQTQIKQPRIALGSRPLVDARRSSREDQPQRVVLPNLVHRNIVPHDLAKHVLLAHAARDQLGILRAEIEHQDPLAGDVGPLRVGRLWMADHHQRPLVCSCRTKTAWIKRLATWDSDVSTDRCPELTVSTVGDRVWSRRRWTARSIRNARIPRDRRDGISRVAL